MIEINNDDMLDFMCEFMLEYSVDSPAFDEIETMYGQSLKFVRHPPTAMTAKLYMNKFKELVELVTATRANEKIRAKNEAVRKAYEQYEILLKLAQ